MNREELKNYLDELLSVPDFKDYCPNGLQVAGQESITRLVTGVTANQALIDAAIQIKAHAIIVHHGFFWKSEEPCIVGIKQQRIKALLAAQINLYAYHLPLDAHASLGNNAQIAQRLGLETQEFFGEQDLGCLGAPRAAMTFSELVTRAEAVFGRAVLAVTPQTSAQATSSPTVWNPPLKKVAWCSGAAQSYFSAAIAAGAQVFISGEISEPCVHLAREYGVAYLACGHHATERFGVQALGVLLAEEFGLEHHYIEIDSPV